MKLPAVGRDDDAGVHDRGPLHPARFDRAAKIRVRIISRVADIANGRETGLQHGHAVRHALDRAIAGGIEQRRKVVVAVIALGNDRHAQMRVGIEKTWEDRGFRKINDLRSRGDGDVSADFLDLVAFHQNDLIGGGFSRFRVEQFSGFDCDDF